MAAHVKPKRDRVFLSYRHRDAGLVRELERNSPGALELYSFPYDRGASDRDWREIVTGLIAAADAVVCVVGADTESSTNVAWELREAAIRNTPVFLAGPGASAFAADRKGVKIINGDTPEEILAALRRAL